MPMNSAILSVLFFVFFKGSLNNYLSKIFSVALYIFPG